MTGGIFCMCEVIVVTSGKGGVGKTTTTANLGVGLSLLGKKVLMIDTDIGLRNLDVVMGLEHRIFYNLVDVVEGNCRIRQAIIRDRQFTGLYLIPASHRLCCSNFIRLQRFTVETEHPHSFAVSVTLRSCAVAQMSIFEGSFFQFGISNA